MGMVTKIGQWLDSRFPAKVVVTQEDYNTLKNATLDILEALKRTELSKTDMQHQINQLGIDVESLKSDLITANEAVKNVRLMNGIQSNASKFINDYKR
jgi:hypothetical protein